MQLISDLSASSFDTWTWLNLHSTNVERPRQVGHSATICDKLLPNVRGIRKISLNLCIDLPHKLDQA